MTPVKCPPMLNLSRYSNNQYSAVEIKPSHKKAGSSPCSLRRSTLREASYHSKRLTTLRLCAVSKSKLATWKRPTERRDASLLHGIPAFPAEGPDMWEKKASWTDRPFEPSDYHSQMPSDCSHGQTPSKNQSVKS